jgi:hypothetical protein
VLDLIEIQAPEGARSPDPLVDPEWARRYPAEEIWKARKTALTVEVSAAQAPVA